MLILTRKEGEEVVLPQSRLTISVLGIESKRVRLGFSGPPEVTMHRKEVFQRIAASRGLNETPAVASEDSFIPVRVLIADPDEYLVDSYRTCLEQHGFEVLVATNGLECVERLRNSAPDVLVLEPALPWGGGDGVLAMMREEPDVPRIPVIALTLGHDRGVLYRLAPFPIDDFQVKPLSGDRLVQRVRAVVKRRPADVRPARIPR